MRQLAELPRSAVGAQFGAVGERLQALARGDDPRPLVPRRRPARVESAEAFDPPLDGIGAVGLTLRRLAAGLCDDLRRRHRAPGRAVLELHLEDAPTLRVAQVFPQPALEPDWIARLLLSRVEAAARARTPRYWHGQSTDNQGANPGVQVPSGIGLENIRPTGAAPISVRYPHRQTDAPASTDEDPEEPRVVAIGLVFDRLADPAARQLSAFEAQAGRWEELRWSLERIRHRFGSGRLWRAELVRPSAALAEHRFRLAEINE